MDKNSFLIYLDYEEQFNLLTDEQAGQLIKALIKYEKTRKITPLEGATMMAFSFIKAQLDRDREKWKEQINKRSEAGKKGMLSRWSKNNKTKEEDNKNNNVITNDNKDNNVINVITRHNKNN